MLENEPSDGGHIATNHVNSVRVERRQTNNGRSPSMRTQINGPIETQHCDVVVVQQLVEQVVRFDADDAVQVRRVHRVVQAIDADLRSDEMSIQSDN